MVLVQQACGVSARFDTGTLLVVDQEARSVLAFGATTGGFLREIVSQGHERLTFPVGATLAPDGTLLVANFESSDQQVVRFNLESGAYLETVFTHPRLEETVSLSFSGDVLYALGNDHHNVMVIDAATHTFRREFGSYELGFDPSLRWPHDMYLSPSGLLYITNETPGTKVQVWDPARDEMSTAFGSELVLPVGIDLGPDDIIYVADWSASELGEDRIACYDSGSHAYRGELGRGRIRRPTNLKVGPSGLIYVSTEDGVMRIDPETDEVVLLIASGDTLRVPRGLLFLAD